MKVRTYESHPLSHRSVFKKLVFISDFVTAGFLQEYADYYDVIKRPIDLSKIYDRIKINYYDSVDALVSDFCLMFDNACRYNEPESAIYKASN